MPLASFSQRRLAFRALLERAAISMPGSVWDAVSGRLAQAAGYEFGLMGGSIASAVVLGAPDIVLLTLSEFADQARRLTRGCDLPLLVDADHGYGNPLNAMRTVSELEAAGVAALTIEDTLLPRRHGGPEAELVPLAEFRDKLRAAVAGRTDASLCVIGRTGGLNLGGLDEALERVRACNQAGVDAIFVVGVRDRQQLEALHAETSLPLLVNSLPLEASDLVSLGVRIVMQGHQPHFVMLNALREAYEHLRRGGAVADLQKRALPPEHLAVALREQDHRDWQTEFLAPA